MLCMYVCMPGSSVSTRAHVFWESYSRTQDPRGKTLNVIDILICVWFQKKDIAARPRLVLLLT